MVGTDTLLLDRYRLGTRLAVGGMGTVFAATDEKLNRPVAIKVLADNLAHDESFVERFRREARAAAGLGHPNIASVYDYGEENGCHFIVMELVDGRDLAQVLRTEGPLSPARAIAIVSQICAALGHAHAAGIIHRDVKPANVIVDGGDRVKVTDFGIARAAGDSKLTMTGSVLGTAHYISPEQANGAPLSQRSDLYSLGIVVYESLTGALPFTGSSPMSVAMRHLNDDIPAPSELNPAVPQALDRVVEKATMKDPAARYVDAGEMGAALEASVGAPGASTTAVLEPTTGGYSQAESSVWPIPGDRWDPTSLGRKVLIVFGVLAVVALALLVWRVSSGLDEPTRAERGTGTQPEPARSDPALESDNFTVDPSVIGMDLKDVETLLKEAGMPFTVETVGGEALADALERFDIDPEVADPGEVFATVPSPGEEIHTGEAITLFVSEGFDDDLDDKPGKSERSKGHGNDKHGKEEDDD
jgi:serine/threonine-protein kinase